jgi:hypothetical protein
MAKDKISDYSSTANSNTDIAGINIDEGCAPSGINDAIRTLMAQLKTWQSGGQDVYIHPAGSASAPSITATGDTNTGVFFPAADTVGISTGGTERARVDSAGRLGIGTTSPTSGYLLDVRDRARVASTSNYVLDLIGSGTNGSTLQVYADNSIAALITTGTSAIPLTFFTGGSERMRLDASGNLGVGTTSPSTKLQVVGTGRFSSGTEGITLFHNGSIGYIETSGSSTTPIGFANGGTERARIDSSGNLLVGTTTSSARLSTVTTGNAVAGFFKNDASGYQTVTMQNAGGSGTRYLAWFIAGTTDVGSINSNGTTTTYSTSSDYRLKNITGPVTGYKERLNALQPKQGSWKVDGSEFRGFLAHEFADSYPASVNGEKDAVDENGNPKYQGMQASSAEVIADLVAYIKELETRLSALEQA